MDTILDTNNAAETADVLVGRKIVSVSEEGGWPVFNFDNGTRLILTVEYADEIRYQVERVEQVCTSDRCAELGICLCSRT